MSEAFIWPFPAMVRFVGGMFKHPGENTEEVQRDSPRTDALEIGTAKVYFACIGKLRRLPKCTYPRLTSIGE